MAWVALATAVNVALFVGAVFADYRLRHHELDCARELVKAASRSKLPTCVQLRTTAVEVVIGPSGTVGPSTPTAEPVPLPTVGAGEIDAL